MFIAKYRQKHECRENHVHGDLSAVGHEYVKIETRERAVAESLASGFVGAQKTVACFTVTLIELVAVIHESSWADGWPASFEQQKFLRASEAVIVS